MNQSQHIYSGFVREVKDCLQVKVDEWGLAWVKLLALCFAPQDPGKSSKPAVFVTPGQRTSRNRGTKWNKQSYMLTEMTVRIYIMIDIRQYVKVTNLDDEQAMIDLLEKTEELIAIVREDMTMKGKVDYFDNIIVEPYQIVDESSKNYEIYVELTGMKISC